MHYCPYLENLFPWLMPNCSRLTNFYHYGCFDDILPTGLSAILIHVTASIAVIFYPVSVLIDYTATKCPD